MNYDVVIVGGGPAGLSAALTLGRGRKRVLLCDAGVPRNAAAHGINNFVSRDGIPPAEFRRISKEQLTKYPHVEVRNLWLEGVSAIEGGFSVQTAEGTLTTRRILLATGMIDALPDLPGYKELWGKSLFQCPYCHGYEIQDRAWGLWVSSKWIEHGISFTGWTRDLILFTNGEGEVSPEVQEKLARAKITLDERKILGLRSRDGGLCAVEVEGGEVAREFLFVHPPQVQTALVQSLGLALDEMGFVKINEQHQTSTPGIYAAGDLTTMRQSAIIAASTGGMAGVMINMELSVLEACRFTG